MNHKVDIDQEVKKLENDNLGFFQPFFSDGSLVEKKTLSNYIAKCSKRTKKFEQGINPRCKYGYHLDIENNACVLFVECSIEEYKDFKLAEKGLRQDFVVVKIYRDCGDFISGEFVRYYGFNFRLKDGSLKSDYIYYGIEKTEIIDYESFSIYKDLQKLQPNHIFRPSPPTKGPFECESKYSDIHCKEN